VGEDSFSLDATNSGSLFDRNTHVALLAPVLAPLVFQDPIILIIFGAPTNEESTWISVSLALSAVKDARLVELEGCASSVNRNRERLFVERSLNVANIVSFNVAVAGGLDVGLELLGRHASASLLLVLVVKIKNGTVIRIVVESLVRRTAWATLAIFRAVDEFLLGETEESSGTDKVSTF
jgi:hypothetical protein